MEGRDAVGEAECSGSRQDLESRLTSAEGALQEDEILWSTMALS